MRLISRGKYSLVLPILSALIYFQYSIAQSSPESLAPNMSFEEGQGNQPAQWGFYSWNDSEGWWESEHARSGHRSLGLRGLNGGWSTNLRVEPGEVYDLRFYYRAEGGPSQIVLFVRVPMTPRKMETIVYKPAPAFQADQRGQFVKGEYVGGADEKGWVLFEGGDFKTDSGAKTVNILIKLRSKNPDAKAWLDDIILEKRERPKIPKSARLLRKLKDGTVWTDSENRKILPEQEPPTGEELEGVKVAASQGEYESFQIAVSPDSNWRSVNWRWSDFSGPAPLDKGSLRCRRVETINLERVMGPHSHKGLNPDPLTDRLPCEVAAGATQAFWFTLYTPRKQEPGVYQNKLTLIRNGKTICELPLLLHCRNFAIPRRPSLDVRSSFRAELALRRESGEKNAVLKRYYHDFFDHRTRCSPGARVRVRLEADRAVVDATTYLKHLQFMRDQLGAKRFSVPSLWIGHKGTHKMPPDAEWMGRRIFANSEMTQLSPAFEKPFHSYMSQLVEKLKEEDLFLSPTVRFFDEPNLNDKGTVNGLRTLSKLLLDIEPKLRVAIAATSPHPELRKVIRLWILHTDAWYRELRNIEAAREEGCRIYVYNNAVNYPEHRPIRVRLWPWLLKKYEVDGTYSWWGTVCWRGPMEDPWTAGEGNSGVLLYPPRSNREHGPIDSVRWELFREGLEDYEYLHLAESLAERLEKAGKQKEAKKGRSAVAAALALVEKWPNVRGANDEPYTLDVTAVASAREKLAEAIVEMNEKIASMPK